MDLVKDHKELYDKTNEHFKDKASKEYLCKRFTNSCKLCVKVFKTWFELQRTCYGKLTKLKSGRPQKRLQNVKTGYRISLDSCGCTSDARDSANHQALSPRPEEPVLQLLQHMPSTELQLTWIVWRSACGQQTPHYSLKKSQAPPQLQGTFSQPAGHRTVHAVIIRQKQETITHAVFCNYVVSELEGLEEKEFQIFRREAVKFLSCIQSRAERGLQSQQPQQQSLSQRTSATSTFVPRTFQQPQQAAPARDYILTTPETQMPARQVIQTAQQSQVATKGQQQQSRGQLTSLTTNRLDLQERLNSHWC